jgi:3-oxoacyl-[acyl-carrier protein] reductase
MRTCIVTGASSGIGRATVIEMARGDNFSNIAIIGRNEKELFNTIELASVASHNGVSVRPYVFDLEDLGGIGSLIDKIFRDVGSIDALLNAAGYAEPTALVDTEARITIQTYTVNVFALLELIKYTVQYLKKSRGKIINIASTAGITPRPGWISYSSSKAAVISISSTLSLELSEYGIRVYCISPGRCATALRRKLAPDEDFSKIMQPEDVAKYICYLLAENEICLDGQNIIIRRQQ